MSKMTENELRRLANRLIVKSQEQNEIVHHPWSEALEEYLLEHHAEDSVENGSVVELWGDDSDGAFRIHLDKPAPVKTCGCGLWTGEPCQWSGPPSEMVVVEYMPPYLRASHAAARNSGTWPENGAERVEVEQSCAERLLSDDDEAEWARVVRKVRT